MWKGASLLGRVAAMLAVAAAAGCEQSGYQGPAIPTMVAPVITVVEGGPSVAGSFTLRAELPVEAVEPTEVWLHALQVVYSELDGTQTTVEVDAVETDHGFPLVVDPGGLATVGVRFESQLPHPLPTGLCAALLIPTVQLTAEVYDAVMARNDTATDATSGMVPVPSPPTTLGGAAPSEAEHVFDPLWEAALPWIGTQSSTALAVSPAGQVAIVATTDSGFGAGGTSAIPAASAGAFLLELDPAHQPMWAQALGPGTVTVGRVAHDPLGNVIIGGNLGRGTLQLGGEVLTNEIGALPVAFVSKLSAASQPISTVALRSTSTDVAFRSTQLLIRERAIAVDATGNVHVAGWFAGEADLAGHATGALDAGFFLLQLDGSGALTDFDLFANDPGNGPRASLDAAAAAADGSVVVAGAAFGPLQLGGSTLDGGTSGDLVVARFDVLGSHVYSRRFSGSPVSVSVRAVAVGAQGEAFVLADVSGVLDVADPDSGASAVGSSLVLALDPAGEVLWARITEIGATSDIAVSGDRVLVTRDVSTPDHIETRLEELSLDGRLLRSQVIGCGGVALVAPRAAADELVLAIGTMTVDLGGGARTGASSSLDLFVGGLSADAEP